MNFMSSYSLVAILTIATANADYATEAQKIDSKKIELVPNQFRQNYSVEQEMKMNSKQDGVEQKNDAPNQTEEIKNSKSKLTKMPPKVSTISQLDMLTDHREATDIRIKVTTDHPEAENNFDEVNLTMNDNEVAEKDSFISDLLSDYYDEIDDTELDVGINQTPKITTNLHEANDNEQTKPLSNEIAQIENVVREREIIQQESLETTMTTNQQTVSDDVKSEFEKNLYLTLKVEAKPEAIGTSKLINNNKISQDKHKQLDNKVINDLELNMTARPQGIDDIESNLSSAAGSVEPELTTNHSNSSLKPIKHRHNRCSRLYKLIRSIFFPWRLFLSKLKCALLSTNQD